MPLRGLTAFLALFPALLFGQPGAGTLTVTASSNSNPPPDQAIFSINVGSGVGQSFDSIVTALGPVGVSAANLSSVYYQQIVPTTSGQGSAPPQLTWTFQLVAPIAQTQSTAASLAALSTSLSQNHSGLTLSFNIQGSQVSQQAIQNCDFTALMASARAEAQSIAAASGAMTGAVVGLSGAVSQGVPVCSATVTFGLPVSRSGPNTITISASRTSNPAPDTVLFQVSVTSVQTAGLDDINSALANAGISGAVFSGIENGLLTLNTVNGQPSVTWYFTLSVPFSKLSSTLNQLTAAEPVLSMQNPSLSLSFYIQGVQASAQAQPPCQQSTLIADARTLAQSMAAAAGVSVGPILNLSDQSASAEGLVAGIIPAVRIGLASFLLGVPAVSPAACSLSVQFQLQ